MKGILYEERMGEILKKGGSNPIYNCTQSKLIYMNEKLLGLGIYSYLCLRFGSNRL